MVVVDQADWEVRRAVVFLGADMMLEDERCVALSPFVVDPERLERLRRSERRILRDIEAEGIEI